MATTYQHNLKTVEDYLHHRSPYLMLQSIDRIEEEFVECGYSVSGNEHFVTGHFPGAPIVPGAILQEMTTQAAGVLIAARHNPMEKFNTHDPFFNEYALGVLVKVTHSRFRGFARPGDRLKIRIKLTERFENLFEFRGKVHKRNKLIMSNVFRLANIRSETLQGVDA